MECDLYFVSQGSVRAELGVGGGSGGGAGSVGLPGGLPCQHTSPSHRPPPTHSPHINNQAHSTRQQLIRAPLLVIVQGDWWPFVWSPCTPAPWSWLLLPSLWCPRTGSITMWHSWSQGPAPAGPWNVRQVPQLILHDHTRPGSANTGEDSNRALIV